MIDTNSTNNSRTVPIAGDENYCIEEHAPLLTDQEQEFAKKYFEITLGNADQKTKWHWQKAYVLFRLHRYFKPDSSRTVEITTPGNQKFKLYEESVVCGDKDQIETGRLAISATINGAQILVNKPVTLHENFSLATGVLEKDFYTGYFDDTGKEVVLQAGSGIEFFDDDGLEKQASVEAGYLKDDITVYGLRFLADTKVNFHQSGLFDKGPLSEDTKINGIWYAGGHSINFYENGQLRAATLLYDETIDGVDLNAGTRIKWNEEGEFQGYYIFEEQVVDLPGFGPTRLAADTWLEFHNKNLVSRFTPTDKIQINGILFQAGEEIQYYNNGQLHRGRLLNDIEIPGYNPKIKWRGGNTLMFHENGNVLGGIPVHDVSLEDVFDDKGNPAVMRALEWVEFYDNKIFSSGYPKDDLFFDGLLYDKDQEVRFFPDNTFRDGHLKYDTPVFENIYGKDKIVMAAGTLAGYDMQFHRFFGSLRDDVTINAHFADKTLSIVLEKGKVPVQFHDNGIILGGKPKTLLRMDEELVFGDWVEFDKNENLIGGVLAQSFDRDGHHLEEGQYIEIYPSGAIKGYKVKEKFNPAPDLYPELELGGERWVEFHDGSDWPSGAKLAKNFPMQTPEFESGEVVFAKDQWIEFDEDGFVTGGKLAQDATYHHPFYGNITFKKGEWIEFYPDGSFKGGHLAENQTIWNGHYQQNFEFMEDHWFEVYQNQIFKSGTLADEINIANDHYGNLYFAKEKSASFYPLQNLKNGTLSDTTEINTTLGHLGLVGEDFDDQPAENISVEFLENDHLRSGYLDSTYIIWGNTFQFGKRVYFEWSDGYGLIPELPE